MPEVFLCCIACRLVVGERPLIWQFDKPNEIKRSKYLLPSLLLPFLPLSFETSQKMKSLSSYHSNCVTQTCLIIFIRRAFAIKTARVVNSRAFQIDCLAKGSMHPPRHPLIHCIERMPRSFQTLHTLSVNKNFHSVTYTLKNGSNKYRLCQNYICIDQIIIANVTNKIR